VKAAYVDPNIDRQMDFMESELAQRAWIAGKDFSAANIQMSFPLEAAAARGLLRAAQINLSSFLTRIHAGPPISAPLHAPPNSPRSHRASAIPRHE
jgi:glutathione S-transferase